MTAMESSIRLDGRGPVSTAREAVVRPSTTHVPDDRALLRKAAELSRDVNTPRAMIYWTDLIASAVIGYGALYVAATQQQTGVAIVAGIIAVLALYRAISFIHELTHIRPSRLPGFHLGWNLIVGIPMLTPSFMYEEVHNQHHARTRYGTADDPEYLPLALMKPWTLPTFVLVAALAPVGFLIRFGILSPLSALFPALRKPVVERYSALSINPHYRRREPEGDFRRWWHRLEAACTLWAIGLVTAVCTGILPLHAFLVMIGVVSGVAVINQVRTLVAHLWENEGEAMSVTAQYLDSVNVPPPAMLPMLWAPVGLRYHALHHLLPGVPYHSLGEVHRRLSAELDQSSPYHKSSHSGLPVLLRRLIVSTLRSGR
nr:fatty acid desaturase [Stakelama pacifica]